MFPRDIWREIMSHLITAPYTWWPLAAAHRELGQLMGEVIAAAGDLSDATIEAIAWSDPGALAQCIKWSPAVAKCVAAKYYYRLTARHYRHFYIAAADPLLIEWYQFERLVTDRPDLAIIQDWPTHIEPRNIAMPGISLVELHLGLHPTTAVEHRASIYSALLQRHGTLMGQLIAAALMCNDVVFSRPYLDLLATVPAHCENTKGAAKLLAWLLRMIGELDRRGAFCDHCHLGEMFGGSAITINAREQRRITRQVGYLLRRGRITTQVYQRIIEKTTS